MHILRNAGRTVLEDSPYEISFFLEKFLDRLDRQDAKSRENADGDDVFGEQEEP